MMLRQRFSELKTYLDAMILGQPTLTENLMIALIADGHLLVEGPPGLAKTRAIQALSNGISAQYHRIQFTPDLLPADLTGTDIYRSQTGQFQFEAGPIFHNLVLADEINRAPAKVQSALLEAMAERQVTVGKHSYALDELFLVMATQNPLENEGTYPLPEAQLDRFLLHLKLDYPDARTERQILTLARAEATQKSQPSIDPITQTEIFQARQDVLNLHLDDSLEEYMVQLVMATRHPEKYSDELAQWIEFGVSPRATIALERCARARAWLQQRDFITPEDIQQVLPNVFRHRILRSYHAEAQNIDGDKITQKIMALVAVP
jgi:MoxR-like ATPase